MRGKKTQDEEYMDLDFNDDLMGQSRFDFTDYNNKGGNLLKVSKGEYTKYSEKVKKQKKAAKDLVKATDAVEIAVKKMRGRPRKNPSDTPTKTKSSLTDEQKK
jgi:hypothetical protein